MAEPYTEGRDEKAAYFGRLRTETPWLPPSSFEWAWQIHGLPGGGAMPTRENYNETLKGWWGNFPALQNQASRYYAKYGIWPDMNRFEAEYGGKFDGGVYTAPGGTQVFVKPFPGGEPRPLTAPPPSGTETSKEEPWTEFLRAMQGAGVKEFTPLSDIMRRDYGLIAGRLAAQSLMPFFTTGAEKPSTSEFMKGAVGAYAGAPGAAYPQVDVDRILRQLAGEAAKPETERTSPGPFGEWLSGLGPGVGVAGLQDIIEAAAAKRYTAPLRRQLFQEGALSKEWQRYQAFAPGGQDFLNYLQGRQWF